MRIRHETGIATFIQFVVGVFLSIISGAVSVIGDCIGTSSGECISNAFVSLILIIILVFWLGFLLALGYVTQDRRSPRLAMLLIGAEGLSALIYLFDTMHSPDIISRLTNLVSFLIAAWVIFVAWHILRAKGGRIVKNRTQRHKLSS